MNKDNTNQENTTQAQKGTQNDVAQNHNTTQSDTKQHQDETVSVNDPSTISDSNNQTENEYTKQVQEANEKALEFENKWKRAAADYFNLERRTAEEKLHTVTYANMQLIKELLPVVDHIELLQKHLVDEGLNMIVKEVKQVLERNDVKEIDTQDKEFDPNIMEAIELVEGEKNKVIETTQKGYKLKEKLIRPACVRVGKGNNLQA